MSRPSTLCLTTVVLVGELNPYGRDPRYALYDEPVGSAGWRLRTRVLRVNRATYFGFKRHNLCVGKYSVPEARVEAGRLYLEQYDSRRVDAVFVLLGRKVATAFGCAGYDPFTRPEGMRIVLLPHPSGLCREWNVPLAYDQAGSLLKSAVPCVPWGEGDSPRTSGAHPR